MPSSSSSPPLKKNTLNYLRFKCKWIDHLTKYLQLWFTNKDKPISSRIEVETFHRSNSGPSSSSLLPDSWTPMKSPKQRLKFESGAHYIPLPKENSLNGDDAHFISKSEPIVGVADGVGAWTKRGIDAGEFARQLMQTADALHPYMDYNSLMPIELLRSSFNRISASGSSTVCILALKGECLHAANVGDSGFVVVRNGIVVYRSEMQCHSFNCPYQLGHGDNGDSPACAKEMQVVVAAGDTVVVGTDGLFDNLFDREIASAVRSAKKYDISAGSLAYAIAVEAKSNSKMQEKETPYSKALSEFHGKRCTGGKPDDITVVVMYIVDADALWLH